MVWSQAEHGVHCLTVGKKLWQHLGLLNWRWILSLRDLVLGLFGSQGWNWCIEAWMHAGEMPRPQQQQHHLRQQYPLKEGSWLCQAQQLEYLGVAMQLERIPQPEEQAQGFRRDHQMGQMNRWVNPESDVPGFR
jgi:hypothetical protein